MVLFIMLYKVALTLSLLISRYFSNNCFSCFDLVRLGMKGLKAYTGQTSGCVIFHHYLEGVMPFWHTTLPPVVVISNV